MALMEVKFSSETLGMNTGAYVILPQKMHGIGVDGAKGEKERYPVLYLLHGASDDHTIWLRRTSIERYVASMGLAVVMPEVLLSRYENMAHGPRYQDFIVEELPKIMESFFPISGKREDKFIAGLSMGGMGTLKIALQYPDKYAAAGVLSSGNLFYRTDRGSALARGRASGGAPIMEAVYGTSDLSKLQKSDWDPFVLGERNLEAGCEMPKFFHACGTEDFLLDAARITRDWFKKHPSITYEYHEGPGAHTWAFWDEWIQAYLEFIREDVEG